jgi:hypothetical protein
MIGIGTPISQRRTERIRVPRDSLYLLQNLLGLQMVPKTMNGSGLVLSIA